ncbi:unnamed protein product, partial [Coregonus sp. 'balchen']
INGLGTFCCREPELSDAGSDEELELPARIEEGSHNGSIRKGCDPCSQTQRSKLQHRRARINQQINKEMRMRAGAENLFSEAINVPMIPLGLKETKEVDLTVPLKDVICEHYGEDSSLFEKEIKEFMELRQAMRTPSRNEAGLELLIGARQDRSATAGIDRAIDAFQRAAGAFNYLKENFSNAPSLDMSGPSLCMLVRLMIAQVQECVFERVTLTTQDTHFITQLQVAKEAARTLVKDYVPFSWASMVQVKAEHFRALSHYNAAVALCDHALLLPDPHSARCSETPRTDANWAHLRCAVIRHEEAMRVHGLCKILRKMDILQEVLSFMYKRSLDKYSEMDREDDFDETAEAPEIHSQTQHKPDITPPNFSTVPVTDIFQRLGPLSVFCARARWGPVRVVCLQRGEGGLGLTLRGDSPVLVAGVVPGGCAQEAGLREGDYIVAVDGEDFKWAKHGEVDRRPVMLSPSGDEENARLRTMGGAKGQSTAPLLNWNRKKNRGGGRATKRLGSTFSL